MENHKACIEALNDLVQINNDRIVGYQKAIDELKEGQDSDLRSLFNNLIDDSRGYKDELEQMIRSYGGDPAAGTTMAGKLYRAWMDIKATFSGKDRAAVLENCEAGEDAAQKAYQSALDDEEVMPETKALIRRQQAQLSNAHDQIKQLRDATA